MALVPVKIPSINFFGAPVEATYFRSTSTGRAVIYLDDFATAPADADQLVRATSYGLGVLLADAHAQEATSLHLGLRDPAARPFLPLDLGLGIGVALGVDPGTHFEGLAALSSVQDLDLARLNFGAAQMTVTWDDFPVEVPAEALGIQQDYCARLGIERCPSLGGLPTIFRQVQL
ncbi:MAG: glycerate kinase [Corynebacterium sp.]|nr:glycerate kinase [Corynebacterium sp.]